MIDFSQIPLTLLTPGAYAEFDTSQMRSGLPTAKTRTLIIGQKLGTGSATANQLYRMTSGNLAKEKFGQGSMLANMVRKYRENDKTTEIWAMGVADNGAGVAATGTFTFSGTVTAAGTLALLCEDQRIKVGVSVGQATTSIATAAAAAINAVPDLAMTATAAGSVVTLLARHKGVESNSLYVDYNYDDGDYLPAGLAVAVVAMSGGTGNPDATSAITALGDEAFATIVIPWTDTANLALFEQAAVDRSSALRMNYSEVYAAKYDTYGNLLTFGGNRNSAFLPVGVMKAVPTAPWSFAAANAAQIAFSAKNDPGRPFNTLVLKGVLPPRPANRFTRQEREFLLEAGLTTFVVNADGTVAIERVVTTYKTNAQGFADTSLQDLNSILLLYYFSYTLQVMVATKFPRYKLGDDGVNYGPGQKVATPKTIKAEVVALATLWAEAGLIENLDQFITDLVVERDASDRNRVNCRIRPDLINSFQVFAALVQPIL
jgi:phage tail sheath gpL-like